MIIYQSDKVLFKFSYILRRTLVGMIFPFIISLIGSMREDRDSWFLFFCVFFLIIGSPFFLFGWAHFSYRCRFTLRKLAVDEENRKIEISYLKFKRERNLIADIHDIEIKFRRDWSTRSEYYVLEFYHKGKLIFTQYQEGDWNIDLFFRVVKELLENEVNCTFNSYGMRKRILEHE